MVDYYRTEVNGFISSYNKFEFLRYGYNHVSKVGILINLYFMKGGIM